MNLKNRGALITGASRGIGKAIAESLAREGVRLFLTARDHRRLQNVKQELDSHGATVGIGEADLADQKQIGKMFDSARDFLGEIDILVNNAGLGIESEVVNMSSDDWDRTLNVNLRAAFLLSKLAAGGMISRKSGHIINIGSGASQTPIAGFAAYCASKYGLLGFSESLGLELRQHNIKVSIILPGSTATYFGRGDPAEKIKSKPGILNPSDIADSVIYLLKQSEVAWTSIMNLRPLNLTGGRK